MQWGNAYLSVVFKQIYLVHRIRVLLYRTVVLNLSVGDIWLRKLAIPMSIRLDSGEGSLFVVFSHTSMHAAFSQPSHPSGAKAKSAIPLAPAALSTSWCSCFCWPAVAAGPGTTALSFMAPLMAGAWWSSSRVLCTQQGLWSGQVNLVAAASASRVMNLCPAGWEPQLQSILPAHAAVVSDRLVSGKVIYLRHSCAGYG